VPRDAYILRVATTVGRLEYSNPMQSVSRNRTITDQNSADRWVTQLTPPLVGPGRHPVDEP
jgi:hypothetical protein